MSKNAPIVPSPLRTEIFAVTSIDSSPAVATTAVHANNSGHHESEKPVIVSAATAEALEPSREMIVKRVDQNRLKSDATSREQPDEKKDRRPPAAESIHDAGIGPEKLRKALEDVGLRSDEPRLNDQSGSDKTPPKTPRNSFSSLSPYDPLLGPKENHGIDPMFR